MNHQDIALWLQPLPDDISGPDLEYDPFFLELVQAAKGRGETQFASAEPPAWTRILELTTGLFERTLDLRVALLWGRATVHVEGLEGLAPALELLHGLLEHRWDHVHPRPDPSDGDTLARLGILGSLNAVDGLLGDVRQAPLAMDRDLGGLRVRDVEIALGRLPARDDDAVPVRAQVEGLLADLPDRALRLRGRVEMSLDALERLRRLMNERFGADRAVETRPLRDMLLAVLSLLPAPVADATIGTGISGTVALDGERLQRPSAPAGVAGGLDGIHNRQDATHAIRQICAYLDRNEPTSPAQLLLRRAERLIDKNFLQLVQDLAPGAVDEVTRVLGLDLERPDAGSIAQ